MKKWTAFIAIFTLCFGLMAGMAELPPVSAEESAKILFQDNFESGKIDTEKWTLSDGCTYTIAADPDDPENMVLANPLDVAAGNWANMKTTREFTDFTLTMRVYTLSDLNGTFGFAVRSKNGQYFYMSFNTTWMGEWGYSDGSLHNYNDKFVISEKIWHDVRLIVSGNEYIAYVDGILCDTATDDRLTSGIISISFWNKAFYLDDVVIYEGRVEEPILSGGDTTYYVDSDAAPGGDGLSPETAWNSLKMVNKHKMFFPGDKILLKRGCKFTGVLLTPRGSGEDGNPITLGAYGEGPMPIIDPSFPMEEKYNTCAIRIRNQSYWLFENIQVQNSNPDNPGVPEAPRVNADGTATLPIRSGIGIGAAFISGQNEFVVRGIVVRNCKFTLIDSSGGDESNSYKSVTDKTISCGGACIGFSASSSEDGKYNAWVDGVLVENCEFYNYAGLGVNSGFSGKVYNKNVVVRNNYFHCDEDYTASNHAAYICHSTNPILEYNVFENLTCGMAFQVCKDGIMRYNVAKNMDGLQHGATTLLGKPTYWDGCAFDVDSNCTGDFEIYGNFTYDCYSGTFSHFNFHETNATVNIHDNICYNDKQFVWYNATGKGYTVNVYNNTFIRDSNCAYSSREVLGVSVSGLGDDKPITFKNNILYCVDNDLEPQLKTQYFNYENNLYCGEFSGDVVQDTDLYDLKLNIPTDMKELDNISYCGNIEGTTSFCDSGLFLLLKDSPGFNNGTPEHGVNMEVFRQGREYFDQLFKDEDDFEEMILSFETFKALDNFNDPEGILSIVTDPQNSYNRVMKLSLTSENCGSVLRTNLSAFDDFVLTTKIYISTGEEDCSGDYNFTIGCRGLTLTNLSHESGAVQYKNAQGGVTLATPEYDEALALFGNRWVQLRLEVIGNTANLYYDGVKKGAVSGEDVMLDEKGDITFGGWTNGKCAVYFDEMMITRPDTHGKVLGASYKKDEGTDGDMRFVSRAFRNLQGRGLTEIGHYVIKASTAETVLGTTVTDGMALTSEQLVTLTTSDKVLKKPAEKLIYRCSDYVDYALRLNGAGEAAYADTEYLYLSYAVYGETTEYSEVCIRTYNGVYNAANQ